MQLLGVIDYDIYVWRVDLAHPAADPNELKNLLANNERSRALEFKFLRDSKRFIIARAALRQILAMVLNAEPHSLQLSTGSYGKPGLAKENLRFNLSHSGDLALIAVARERELGIDVEEMRPMDDLRSIAKRFFAPQEAQRIAAMTDSATITRAFFECWTRKEAFIKATGEGLSRPLDSFRVTFFPDCLPELRIDSEDSAHWKLVNINAGPRYCAALVYELLPDYPIPRILQRQWQPPGYREDSFATT